MAADEVICYALTEVVADEKFSTNPAQVTDTYTESLKYQDALIAPDRVLWKAAQDLEYSTLEKMGCWRIAESRFLLFLPASNPSRASGV